MIRGGDSIIEIIVLLLKNTKSNDTIEYQLLDSRWPLLPHLNEYLLSHPLPSQISLELDNEKEAFPTEEDPYAGGAPIQSTSEFHQFVNGILSYMNSIQDGNVNFEFRVGGSERSSRDRFYDSIEIKEEKEETFLQVGVFKDHLPFIRKCNVYSFRMITWPVIPYSTCIPPYSRQLEVEEKVHNAYLVFTRGNDRVLYLLAKFLFDPTEILKKYRSNRQVDLKTQKHAYNRKSIDTASEVHQLIDDIYQDLKTVKKYNQSGDFLWLNHRQAELIERSGEKFIMTIEVLYLSLIHI